MKQRTCKKNKTKFSLRKYLAGSLVNDSFLHHYQFYTLSENNSQVTTFIIQIRFSKHNKITAIPFKRFFNKNFRFLLKFKSSPCVYIMIIVSVCTEYLFKQLRTILYLLQPSLCSTKNNASFQKLCKENFFLLILFDMFSIKFQLISSNIQSSSNWLFLFLIALFYFDYPKTCEGRTFLTFCNIWYYLC